MNSLHGKVFPSGVIEFSFAHNQWASEWYEGMLAKNKKSPRVIIKPHKVPMVIELSQGLDAGEFNWLERISELLNSADHVLLHVVEGSFRFEKAIHEFTPTKQVITLGATDIRPFAEKHWNHIKYFYAYRYEGFFFDVRKIVTAREGKVEPNSFELITKVRPDPDNTSCHLSFLATGSHVSNEIITWRNSIDKGESGRFSEDETEVQFKVATTKRPLTFLHEVREEFHNHSFEFEGDQIKSHRVKIEKRRTAK